MDKISKILVYHFLMIDTAHHLLIDTCFNQPVIGKHLFFIQPHSKQ